MIPNGQNSVALGRHSRSLHITEEKGVRLDPAALPDLLFQIGGGDLVIRGGGVSLFRRVEFDHFRARNGMRHDRVSGMGLQPELIRQAVLVPAGISPLRIEVEFQDTGNSLTFYPAVATASSASLQLLAQALDPSECAVTYPEGWLGDGLQGHEQQWANQISLRENRFQTGVKLNVKMRSRGCVMAFEFDTSWVDREGQLFRLSEPEGNTVVHFDQNSRSLEVEGSALLSPLMETCFR